MAQVDNLLEINHAKIKQIDNYKVPDLADFLGQSISNFQSSYNVHLTLHVMSSRWYDQTGKTLFSEWLTHREDYCLLKRYKHYKYNKACLYDCAAGVEQEALRTGQPFFHTCWKGVTELVVPFTWDDILELIFYVGIFRGKDPPENQFYSAWEKLPDFPVSKQDELIHQCLEMGLAFYACLQEENLGDKQCLNRREIIREYILRHSCESITLSDLAAHLHVSTSRVSHLCLSLLGMSFQDLVLNVRMKKAEFLLLETDLPIKEIAIKSGFNNVFYFSRKFRSFYNETPRNFRVIKRRLL